MPRAAVERRRRRTDVDVMYTPPAEVFDAPRKKALYVGIVGLVGCAAGFVIAPGHAYRAWLVAFMLALGISLGSLALMMIQHLSGGAWGIFRRIFEGHIPTQRDAPSNNMPPVAKPDTQAAAPAARVPSN